VVHFAKHSLMALIVAMSAQACDGVNEIPANKSELALTEALNESGLDIENISRIKVLADGSLTLNDNQVSISDLAAAIEKLPANRVENFPIIIAGPDVSQGVINQIRDIIHNSAFPESEWILTSVEEPRED